MSPNPIPSSESSAQPPQQEVLPAPSLDVTDFGVNALPSFSTIEAMNTPRLGKDRHSLVNRLVWGFRERHGFDSAETGGGDNYQAHLVKYEDLIKLVPEETRQKILAFSTPENYKEVRTAYRMRASRAVTDEGLERLAREVKVALIWRELIGSGKISEPNSKVKY